MDTEKIKIVSEKGMIKCAYLVSVYKNPEQTNILLKQLIKSENNYVYIHIDQKSQKKFENKLLIHSRIKILHESILVEWGDDSLLKAQLLLLQYAVKDNMDYYIFLSEQDLIIKENIGAFLNEHKDEIFVDEELAHQTGKVYLEYRWAPTLCKLYDNKCNVFRILRRIQMGLAKRNCFWNKKKINREKLQGIKYYHSLWGIGFPKEFAVFALEEIEKDYLHELFFDALIPVEFFWPTLIFNSKFSSQVKTKRKIVYSNIFQNNHPVVIKVKDIKRLEKEPYLFARKFDISVDKKVVDYYANRCY